MQCVPSHILSVHKSYALNPILQSRHEQQNSYGARLVLTAADQETNNNVALQEGKFCMILLSLLPHDILSVHRHGPSATIMSYLGWCYMNIPRHSPSPMQL